MMHAPRYLRHYNSNVRVTGVDQDGAITSESNYLVVETLMEDKTRILQAGRYLDRFVRAGPESITDTQRAHFPCHKIHWRLRLTDI